MTLAKMPMRRALIAALIAATATPALAATSYILVPLDGLEAGSADNWPVAIGATGAIAGMSWTLDSYKAAYWDSTGAVSEIYPGSQSESYAFDVNANEQVVIPGPHIWENGVLTPLAVDIGLYKFSGNLLLNDSQQVAGNIYVDVGGSLKPHAALLTNGITTDLGVLPGMTSSVANGLNNLGDVVGSSYATYSQPRAALWSAGTTVDLGVLPGATTSTAYAINDQRRVVGASGGRMFTWENGVMTDLGAIESGVNMIPNAINSDGEIVGLYVRPGSNTGRAFHWNGGVYTDLSAVAGAGGHCDAADINDAGQIAMFCGGGWRLDPSAPTTDVGVAMSTPSGTASQGAPLTYTIDVSNVGALPATNVRLIDALPASVTFVSATVSQGTCSGVTTVTCNLENIASDAKATVQLTVIPNVGGALTNSASAVANETETNTRNNSSGTYVYVAPLAADVALSLSGSAKTVKRLSQLTYTVNVKNNGPATATGVTVTDTLPSSMKFVSARSSQGSCSGGTTVTCSLGSVNSGVYATVKIVVQPQSKGSYTNTAYVRSSNTDNNNLNNLSSVTTTVK